MKGLVKETVFWNLLQAGDGVSEKILVLQREFKELRKLLVTKNKVIDLYKDGEFMTYSCPYQCCL